MKENSTKTWFMGSENIKVTKAKRKAYGSTED